MRKFKFVGTKEEANGYRIGNHEDIPINGAVYSENKFFGAYPVLEWIKERWVKKEWEEVFEVDSPVSDNIYVTTPDPVNPQHYKNGDVECIDAIKSAVVGKDGYSAVLVANVIKYLWRYESKGGVKDIEKASWYLNKLVEHEQSKA